MNPKKTLETTSKPKGNINKSREESNQTPAPNQNGNKHISINNYFIGLLVQMAEYVSSVLTSSQRPHQNYNLIIEPSSRTTWRLAEPDPYKDKKMPRWDWC